MSYRLLFGATSLPLVILTACAPGRSGSGGIGCSKTSSVLKAPQIRTIDETTPGEPAPSEAAHRKRVMKLFGGESVTVSEAPGFLKSSVGGLNTSGGYIYVTSRQSGDPLGLKRNQNGKVDGVVTRCGVLVEYPKNTGEVKAPGESGDNVFPSSNADSYRFPSEGDPLKIRLYTAAHCLDFSLNESITLRLFKGHSEISSPQVDYIDVPIQVPEILAVKNLRREVKKKITEGIISEDQGVNVLNAFRPATINLTESFGTTGAQGKCAEKPSNIADDTEQYSCATYHDMAVLDVTLPESLPQEKVSKVKELRAAWVNNIKAEETKGPWSEYVKPLLTDSGAFNNLKLFIDHVLDSGPTDSAKADFPNSCKELPAYDLFPNSCTPISCPAGPVGGCTPVICPTLTTKLGLFHPSPANCLEAPINSANSLSFARYITRERLRTFSRYNLVAQVTSLASTDLNFAECSNTDGVCALKDAVDATLKAALPLASVEAVVASFSSNYLQSSRYVDATLSSWKPFLDLAKDDGKLESLSTSDNFEASGPSGQPSLPNLSSQKNLLQEMINPVDFLKLHSNFLIKEDIPGQTALPEATDDTTPRAFMTAPMQNIVGLESFFNSDGNVESNLPIEILPWDGSGPQGNGVGKFLKLFVTKGKLDAFFESITTAFTPPPGQTTPPANMIVIADENSDPGQPLPTKVYLQKGDSGSIFTLDSVPMFALSMVNGEPTSGGAQLAAVPREFEDTDDVIPVGPGDSGSGGGGGGDPSVVINTCK